MARKKRLTKAQREALAEKAKQANEALLTERRAFVWQHRIGGATQRAIVAAWANHCESDEVPHLTPDHAVDRRTIARDIQHGMEMARLRNEATASQYRSLELERLDRLWRAVWPGAAQGAPVAFDQALAISDRRVRLLGLAVDKRQVELLVGQEMKEALARLKRSLPEDEYRRVLGIMSEVPLRDAEAEAATAEHGAN
jgi:hypothetical protein